MTSRPISSARVAGGRGDRAGGRNLVDRSLTASRSAAACSGSNSRAASIVAAYMKTPDYPAHYAKTGSGLNACMASGQLAWMKRHQPERIARATTAFPLQGLALFQVDRRAGHRPVGSQFHIRQFSHAPLRTLDPGGDGHRRLRTASAADRRRDARLASIERGGGLRHRAAGGPAGRARLSRRRPARRWAAAFTSRSGEVGAVDLRLDRHAHALRADARTTVRLNEARSGYSCVFRCPARRRPMQSNMAATLNIDWFLDIAREAAEYRRRRRRTAPRFSRAWTRVSSTPRRGRRSTIPIYSRPASVALSLTLTRARNFPACPRRTTFAGMMRAVYEGLAFAARDCYLGERRLPAKCGSAAARPVRRRFAPFLPPRLARRCASCQARGNRRRRRGDDGRSASGPLWRHAGMRRGLGRARRSGDITAPDANLSKNLSGALFRSISPFVRQCRPHGRMLAQHQTGDIRVNARNRNHRRSFHAAVHVREGDTSTNARTISTIRSHEMPWPDEPMQHGLRAGRHGRPQGISGRRGRDRRDGRRRRDRGDAACAVSRPE